MKIAAITFSGFVNPVKYFQNPISMNDFGYLKSNISDFVSFRGKGPESVNPSRKAFDKLPQEILTCPCCGRHMITPSEIEDLKNSHILQCKAPDAVKILQRYENRMHSVEKEVFGILKEEAAKNPELDFKQILQNLKPDYEKHLIKTQFGIFTLIEKASENIDPDMKKQIKDLLEEEKNAIKHGNNEFRRKRFVNRFEKIFEGKKNSATKEHLIRIAKKLPTAYEDKNAFIVKYASRPAEEIGIRLLSYSMRTIEHVKPQNCKGENHLFNYIPECMRCNSFRQDRPMIQQLEEYPEMFSNAQNLMDKLVDAANKEQISKWYIIKIQQQIYNESDKALELDISKLKMNKRMRDEYLKINSHDASFVEPPKLTKKQLKRRKIKELHIKTNKSDKNIRRK